jgi:hypothetical protein
MSHSAAGRVRAMKSSNDTIENRTLDLIKCLNQLHPHVPFSHLIPLHVNTLYLTFAYIPLPEDEPSGWKHLKN